MTMSHVQHAWQGKAYEIRELEKTWWSLKIQSWKYSITSSKFIYLDNLYVYSIWIAHDNKTTVAEDVQELCTTKVSPEFKGRYQIESHLSKGLCSNFAVHNLISSHMMLCAWQELLITSQLHNGHELCLSTSNVVMYFRLSWNWVHSMSNLIITVQSSHCYYDVYPPVQTSSWNTFCSNVLSECAADEKLNVVPLYFQLEQVSTPCEIFSC